MKTHMSIKLGAILAAAMTLTLPQPAIAQKAWIGTNGTGGDGTWIGANFNPSGVPTTGTSGSANSVYFDRTETLTDQSSLVTIGSGVNARARLISVRNDKLVTIQLEDNSSLTVTNQGISVGMIGVAPASTASLTLQGPTGDGTSATAIFTRFYLANNSNNVGTSYANSLILSGNLNVNLTESYSDVNGKSSITVLDGVTLNSDGTNGSSDFYIRTGAKTNNIYDNRISFLGGSSALKSIRVESLLQLGSNAALTKSTNATGLNIEVRTGGRFEVAGSGLSSEGAINVWTNGTLAVGLHDQTTGLRSGASTFTLQSTADFAAGGRLEFTIFGDDQSQADHITLFGDDALLSGDVRLVLNLGSGFAPETGSWSLLTGTGSNITATFDFGLVNTNMWDVSQFNEAGNWTVTAVPEPTTALLLLAGVGALLAVRKMRRKA